MSEGTRDRLVLCGKISIKELGLHEGCAPSDIRNVIIRMRKNLVGSGCRCHLCQNAFTQFGITHDSDCGIHNGPALDVQPCRCVIWEITG